MTFGINHWRSLEEIKANLKKLDEGMDTKHTLSGVRMMKHDTGKIIDSSMIHMYYMSDTDHEKVRVSFSAAGPLE